MEKISIEVMQYYQTQGLSAKDVSLITGKSISAICNFCKRNNIALPKKKTGGHNAKDITENDYGSLTVLRRAGSKGKLATWECKCLCGNTAICLGSDLRQGKIKTCGCRTGIQTKRNWQGYGDIPKNYWSSLIKNANQRQISVEINIKDLDDLWKEQNAKCSLSGWTISLQEKTASLDRIDNSKGYLINNIQWVHKNMNKMKSIFPQEMFIEMCQAVSNHQKGNQCH